MGMRFNWTDGLCWKLFEWQPSNKTLTRTRKTPRRLFLTYRVSAANLIYLQSRPAPERLENAPGPPRKHPDGAWSDTGHNSRSHSHSIAQRACYRANFCKLKASLHGFR